VAASETWRLRPGQHLHHRQWDGECVLYNDLSGSTHLLDEAALELLLALRRGPATHAVLAAVLQAGFDIDAADLDRETDTLLRDLKHLYLVDHLVDHPVDTPLDTPAC
jgi:PqqD family protein of HPr-rel-A system